MDKCPSSSCGMITLGHVPHDPWEFSAEEPACAKARRCGRVTLDILPGCGISERGTGPVKDSVLLWESGGGGGAWSVLGRGGVCLDLP